MRYSLKGPSYTSPTYTSIAKIIAKTNVKPKAEAMPKGMNSIRCAILFQLLVNKFLDGSYIGKYPTIWPVIGCRRSPSVTYAALLCSTSFMKPPLLHYSFLESSSIPVIYSCYDNSAHVSCSQAWYHMPKTCFYFANAHNIIQLIQYYTGTLMTVTGA